MKDKWSSANLPAAGFLVDRPADWTDYRDDAERQSQARRVASAIAVGVVIGIVVGLVGLLMGLPN